MSNIAKLIQNAADDKATASRKLAMLKKHRITLSALLKETEAAIPNTTSISHAVNESTAWDYDASAYMPTGHLRVTTYAYYDVTTLKSGPIFDALETLTNDGYEPSESSDNASEYSASRTYSLVNKRENVKHLIHLTGYIRESDNATCRKIQTGTRTETVAEYKLICD